MKANVNMNYAVVLSGGVGTRLGANIPKQYIEINGRTIISYCLKTFQDHDKIDRIVIVAAKEWHEFILEEIKKYSISKFFCLADAGISRQHSILSGVLTIKEKAETIGERDAIVVHDAVRPNVSDEIINNALDFGEYDGTLPVINVHDTIYFSADGEKVDSVPNRDCLFSGQTPESFLLAKYVNFRKDISDDRIALIHAGTEFALMNGLTVRVYPGDTHNYKITTAHDLETFRIQTLNEKN